MADHYNAFISYKHATQDIKVAEAIQKGLEHYHIPAAIRKKTGMKKIERIFRDKDELPITSDLSDDISQALENADYLIVICSTNTKQSMWVPREIEYFLRNHNRRQILTVLVDGEPQDVIPEILLREEREVPNDKGELQTIQVSLEPLSCDYRMSIHKANKEELPRLAAALIGCSYDELMNRHRQYKMRRLSLVFGGALLLALGFGGYMMYSRTQIQTHYQEALRNQSRYLANESEQLLNQEQRISAIQLALAALPENDERPVTAEAVRAITKATLAYTTQSGTTMNAAWNYELPNFIVDYKISPEGTTLSARDESGNIAVWDIQTHEKLYESNDPTEKLKSMLYLSDSTLIICYSSYVYAYDIPNNSKLWEYKLDDSYDTFRKDQEIILNSDGLVYLSTNENYLYGLNPETGNIDRTIQITSEDIPFLTLNAYKFSPDNSQIAFLTYTTGIQEAVGIYNIKTQQTTFYEPVDTNYSYYQDLCWVDATHLLISSISSYANSSSTINDRSFMTTNHTNIAYVDTTDLSDVWLYDFTYNDIAVQRGFYYTPGSESFIYYSGNIAETIDLASGAVLYHHNVNDPIIDVSDNDGDGFPLYVMQNGTMAVPNVSAGSDALNLVKYFTDNLADACVKDGIYVLQHQSREIIFYEMNIYDEAWTSLDPDTVLSGMKDDHILSDDILAIMSQSDKVYTLSLCDPNNASLLQQIVVSDQNEDIYSCELIGEYNGVVYIAAPSQDEVTLVGINVETGERTEATLPNVYTPSVAEIRMIDNICYYISTPESGESAILLYDITDNSFTEYPIPITFPSTTTTISYNPKHQLLIYGNQDNYLIHTDSGSLTELSLPDTWNSTTNVVFDPENPCFAITNDDTILIMDADGNIQSTISCMNQIPIGMAFYNAPSQKDNILLVTYANGYLNRYLLNDGTFLGKNEIDTYTIDLFTTTFDIDYENHYIYIQNGQLTNIIDSNNWVELACIEQSFGHHGPTDRFYTYSYTLSKEYHLGYFSHYTTEDLMQKAKDILQGTEMSDEMKSLYGIE